MSSQLKILIAPLDWGLGHTTRCLPIIQYLFSKGYSVTLAAPDTILKFVELSFPEIRKVSLKGYEIRYGKSRKSFAVRMIVQIPKILKAIRRERKWLADKLVEEHFDLVISDNRYGLHCSETPCAIMTHQLAVQSGMGRVIDKILQKIHYHFLEKFDACWVVDNEEDNNLAGKLSHPEKVPSNAVYIGLLSQMTLFSENLSERILRDEPLKKRILILLSGPEPSRSLLEETLRKQCNELAKMYQVHFVSGKVSSAQNEANEVKNSPKSIRFYDQLTAGQLFPLLRESALVVCRSGYSTIMDLAFFGKRALLIPTPGQTEQEYLAKYLAQKFHTVFAEQSEINLLKYLPDALSADIIHLDFTFPNFLESALQRVILKK